MTSAVSPREVSSCKLSYKLALGRYISAVDLRVAHTADDACGIHKSHMC